MAQRLKKEQEVALEAVCSSDVTVPKTEEYLEPKENKPLKSDGGSSDYYKMTITNKLGQTFDVEVGDIIRAMCGNDFDFGNCVKALRRMYLVTVGGGKQGTTLQYDANKIKYFLQEIVRVYESKS